MLQGEKNGLSFYRGGSPGGRVAILLHGLGATKEVWTASFPFLDKLWEEEQWIAPDLPGHGGSRGSPYPNSYGAYAAAVSSLVEPDSEVVILGHSLGGVIALALGSGWFGVNIQSVHAFR